jgi:hypothetical protein
MNIELSEEQVEFLLELADNMRNSNSHGTASPFGIIPVTEFGEIKPEGYGSNPAIIYDGYCIESIEEFLQLNGYDLSPESVSRIKAYKSIVDMKYDSEFGKYIDLVSMKYNKEYVSPYKANFFLTKNGYDQHIKANGHNLCKPKPFAIHLRRNEEMAQVIELLQTLALKVKG